MTIYYVYERATGRFAGSGTPFIDTDTHASTTVPPPPPPPYPPLEPFFDEETQTWEYRPVEGEGS